MAASTMCVGRAEVRLADAEVDDVAALRGERVSRAPAPRRRSPRRCGRSSRTVFSMAFPRSSSLVGERDIAAVTGDGCAPQPSLSSRPSPRAGANLHLGHAHHLEDDRDRPADQQQPVERRDRADQAASLRRHRIAVAERGVVLEREFERRACSPACCPRDRSTALQTPISHTCAHIRRDHRDGEQRGHAQEGMQMVGARGGAAGQPR